MHFPRRWCQSVIFGQYRIFSRSPALCCAVNEVADTVLVAGRENVRNVKISSGMSLPRNITSDLPPLPPGKMPLLPEPTPNTQSVLRVLTDNKYILSYLLPNIKNALQRFIHFCATAVRQNIVVPLSWQTQSWRFYKWKSQVIQYNFNLNRCVCKWWWERYEFDLSHNGF